MSNVEKTAWKIQASCPQGRVLTIDQALVVANVLEEAGLLMPDLPEPYSYEEETAYWYEDTYGIGVGRLNKNSPVRVMLWDSEPGGVLYTDIESARDYALKILAACEYAEKKKED